MWVHSLLVECLQQIIGEANAISHADATDHFNQSTGPAYPNLQFKN